MSDDQTVIEPGDLLNQLYWHSQRTIDEILSETGVSRSLLYSTISALEVGRACPQCAEPLYYMHRTHRASGDATCFECGKESSVAGAPELTRRNNSATVGVVTVGYPIDHGWDQWRDELGNVSGYRAAMIGGAAALGALVGAATTRVLRV